MKEEKEHISRPFRILYGLLGVLFVLMVGGAIVLNNMGDTVNGLEDNVENTDKIVSSFVSPEAREAQTKVVKDLLAGMNCTDQLNLQRLVDELAKSGIPNLAGVIVVVPECQPPLE